MRFGADARDILTINHINNKPDAQTSYITFVAQHA